MNVIRTKFKRDDFYDRIAFNFIITEKQLKKVIRSLENDKGILFRANDYEVGVVVE